MALPRWVEHLIGKLAKTPKDREQLEQLFGGYIRTEEETAEIRKRVTAKVNESFYFKSQIARFKNWPVLAFRIMSLPELATLQEQMPTGLAEGGGYTVDEVKQFTVAAANLLGACSLDRIAAEVFAKYPPTLLPEIFRFVTDISGVSEEGRQAMEFFRGRK